MINVERFFIENRLEVMNLIADRTSGGRAGLRIPVAGPVHPIAMVFPVLLTFDPKVEKPETVLGRDLYLGLSQLDSAGPHRQQQPRGAPASRSASQGDHQGRIRMPLDQLLSLLSSRLLASEANPGFVAAAKAAEAANPLLVAILQAAGTVYTLEGRAIQVPPITALILA